MSLTGKTISLKYIIAKVWNDLGIQDEDDVAINLIEWAADALEFIHVYPQFISKHTTLSICNYKAELPCDFIELEQVEYNGFALRPSNNTFGPQSTTSLVGYLTPYSYNQDKIQNGLVVDPKYYFPNGDSFKLENGYIKASFETGDINIQYTSQPMDCDGFPLVPDHVSFREALYWFIVYKYSYIQWRRGEVTRDVYQDAEYKWKYYCNQAGAEAMMPNLTVLENLKRSWLSLEPNLCKFDSFFDNTKW